MLCITLAAASEPRILAPLGVLLALRLRHPELVEAQRRERRGDKHQSLGVLVGKRLSNHAVDDAEDRRVGTNSERQGQHRHHDEPGRRQERAHSELEILENVLHAVDSGSGVRSAITSCV